MSFMDKVQKFTRMDGWENILTGLGLKSRDKRLGADYGTADFLDMETLDQLYSGDAMAAKIVDLLPDEMTREWIEYKQSDDAEIAKLVMQQLRKINAQESIAWALKVARLHGGSAIILGINDGRRYDQPLDENNIRSFSFLNVLDRWQIYPSIKLYRDPTEPKYGLPESYLLQPVLHSEASMTWIHESRIIRFDGVRVSDRKMRRNLGWGESVLNRLYNALRNYHQTHDAVATIVQDFTQRVYKFKGLADLLANGTEGEDIIKNRMQMVDLMSSIARSVILDEDEDFQKLSTSVSGLDKLVDATERRLTAESGLPHTRLLGESPGASLGEAGASQDRNWYDFVASKQASMIQDPIERMVELILKSKEGPTGGKLPKEWSINFCPLWQQDEGDTAKNRLATAQADALYLDRGVLAPDEVAQSRFAGDGYSMDTVLDVDARSLLQDNPPEVEAKYE